MEFSVADASKIFKVEKEIIKKWAYVFKDFYDKNK